MDTPNSNSIFYIFAWLVIAFFVFLILIWIISYFQEFRLELKSLNCEIERTEGRERKYWKKRRRRLWLSLIPFVKY